MPALEFGRWKLCPDCKGSGGEHTFHVIEEGPDKGKHRPCEEHPCPTCKGEKVVPA